MREFLPARIVLLIQVKSGEKLNSYGIEVGLHAVIPLPLCYVLKKARIVNHDNFFFDEPKRTAAPTIIAIKPIMIGPPVHMGTCVLAL
jgi:hypothetical protein